MGICHKVCPHFFVLLLRLYVACKYTTSQIKNKTRRMSAFKIILRHEMDFRKQSI